LDIEQVNKIKFIRDQIKDILINIVPLNDDEWAFHDELTGIYKTLRKVDLSKLTQTRMNLDAADTSKKQLPLTAAAAVVTGEESLNDRHDLATPGDKAPTLCLRCREQDCCNGESVHLVDGGQVCEKFVPRDDVPCGKCCLFANCDVLANLKDDGTCDAFQPKKEAPGEDKPHRGRPRKAE
jgi:hypothetical protein